MDRNCLAEKRMRLASSIAHFRKMIQRDYHPEFFKNLLIKLQVEQSNVLHQERKQRPTQY